MTDNNYLLRLLVKWIIMFIAHIFSSLPIYFSKYDLWFCLTSHAKMARIISSWSLSENHQKKRSYLYFHNQFLISFKLKMNLMNLWISTFSNISILISASLSYDKLVTHCLIIINNKTKIEIFPELNFIFNIQVEF